MGKKTYGLPYQGSKNSIIKEIIDQLPPAPVFVDLFGGGGAATHCAAVSGKYEKVIYNEFNDLTYQYFTNVINGHIDYNWVSREEFEKNKDVDGYIRYIWSFSNSGTSYMYGKNKEKLKEDMHRLIVENKPIEGVIDNLDGLSYKERHSELNNKIKHSEELQKAFEKKYGIVLVSRFSECQSICNVARSENVEIFFMDSDASQFISRNGRCEDLAEDVKKIELETVHGSYIDLEIPDNAVVYCDAPYINTACGSYSGFNFDQYYEFLRKLCKTNYVRISEYTMPNDFESIWKKEKRNLLSSGSAPVTYRTEHLFKLKGAQ